MDEFLHIVTDPAHVAAEFTFIAVEGLILTPIITRLVRRHDRRRHGVWPQQRKDLTSPRSLP